MQEKKNTYVVDVTPIGKTKINESNISINYSNKLTYTGNPIKAVNTVTYGNIALAEGTDYEVAYTDNINAGTATVTIKGIGNYEGIVTKTFIIDPASIDNANLSGIINETYTGQAHTQSPTVIIEDKTLLNETDFTVPYSNNTDVGTATMTITGIGNYAGIKTVTFRILPVGWYEEEGEQYFYKKDGTKLINGWAKKGNTWFWMDNNGKITKNKWVQTEDKWYFMTSSGAMATGWQKIGGKWYYMNSSGAMTTGWQKIGGKWYYMNSSGAMTTGWQKIGGEWYYMNSNGVMTTGWQKIGSKWYYMNSSGQMVTGTQVIGGKTYVFNSSGVWVK